MKNVCVCDNRTGPIHHKIQHEIIKCLKAFMNNNVSCCVTYYLAYIKYDSIVVRAGARMLIGGCIFIYLGYARLISFEINFITKETSRA